MFPVTANILIVDDMPSLRDVLKAYLRRLGFRNITEADDGQLAYQTMVSAKVAGNPFDLVISDWNMPNMTGIELLKVVRSMPDWKTLPFILLTTESEKDKVLQAVHAHVTNYMVKPVDEEMLRDKLQKAWDKTHPK